MTEREQGRGDGREPLDEDAAWAQIVAGYGEEPPDPPGFRPAGAGPARDGSAPDAGRTVHGEGSAPGLDDGRGTAGDAPRTDRGDAGGDGRDGDARDGDTLDRGAQDGDTLERDDARDGDAQDAQTAQTAQTEDGQNGQDGDAQDGPDGPRRSLTVYAAGTGPRDWKPAPPSEEDDHFVPPDPPPPPRGDTVTRFAWLAVLGGPALLFGTVLFQLDMTWWITTLGIGGFLGGFGTLVARMRDGREDDGFDDPGRGAVV
ncbi:hypothetical protein QNO07_19390 [Streptomyces sp. 549]|uniref:hypothetical protein n=1 Tax=Streptomyces sp. 549 TaxID=3049076 RepID=UPI0024C28977|nr:hypothetical protein [Streptomyces sp. 549]MDK1475555.1 hypothetical protein [Streptomyces sp. 549]